MVFGGSEKYTPEKTDELKNFLIATNAFTTYDHTGFVADIFSEDLPLWLSLESNSVFRPIFRKDKVEEQRGRIIQEIEGNLVSPPCRQVMAFKKAMYKVSPLRRAISENIETMEKFSIDDLKKYHSEGFCPNNAQLFLVGGIPDNIEKLIEDAFGDLPIGKVSPISYEKEGKLERFETVVDRPDFYEANKPEKSRALIEIGLLAPDHTHPDFYSINLMIALLGGIPGSRLYKRVSEREGLTYEIQSDYDYKLGQGQITISTDVECHFEDKTVNVIFEEIQKLREEGISYDELERAKRLLRYIIEKNFEMNGNLCERIGIIDVLYSREESGVSMKDLLENYSKLTQRDIQKAAEKYLPTSREDGNYVLVVGKPLNKSHS